MTLRLITTGMEQVGPGQYQPMYRTFDCKLPPTIDFSQRTVVGFEMIEDEPVQMSVANDSGSVGDTEKDAEE